jgi:hypothetical protein
MALIGVPPGDKRCSRCWPPKWWTRWLPWRRRGTLCESCLDKLAAEMHGELLDPGPTVSRIVDTLMPDDPSQN